MKVLIDLHLDLQVFAYNQSFSVKSLRFFFHVSLFPEPGGVPHKVMNVKFEPKQHQFFSLCARYVGHHKPNIQSFYVRSMQSGMGTLGSQRAMLWVTPAPAAPRAL